MAVTLLPVGKIVHVCDDVVADPVSRKPSILNLWDVVRVPPGAAFPYTLGKVCVVALVSDAEGAARFRAELVQAETALVVRRSRDYVAHFSNRQRAILVAIRLTNVTFPAAGEYLVELFCEGVFMDDLMISVVPA